MLRKFTLLLLLTISCYANAHTEYVLFSQGDSKNSDQYRNMHYGKVTTIVIVGDFDSQYLNFIRFVEYVLNRPIQLQYLVDGKSNYGGREGLEKLDDPILRKHEVDKWTSFVIMKGIGVSWSKKISRGKGTIQEFRLETNLRAERAKIF